MIADNGYVTQARVDAIKWRGVWIPTRTEQRGVDPHPYRGRNVCGRFRAKAEPLCRVGTRYEKKAANFRAFGWVAALTVALT